MGKDAKIRKTKFRVKDFILETMVLEVLAGTYRFPGTALVRDQCSREFRSSSTLVSDQCSRVPLFKHILAAPRR